MDNNTEKPREQRAGKNKPVIGWWSGGVTSAVAIKKAIELYGLENVRVVFIDTFNEDDDTYRFKKDCEAWYGLEIETISRVGIDFESIQDVWRRYKSLNVANGAICSAELKRMTRQIWEKDNVWSHQVFGFDIDEPKRAISMKNSYPEARPVFPLLMYGLSKKDCIGILDEAGISIPITYLLGFLNNNCFKTGCVQGGIGYWQKMREDFPDKFKAMADIEHELTNLKGKPVTMLKDQSKEGKSKIKGENLVFLLPHPDYPQYKDLSMMKGRPVKPLFECNGMCATNDLERNPTEKEINFED